MPTQPYPVVREVGTPTTASASGTTCVLATSASLRRGDLLVIFDTRDYGTLSAMTAPAVTLQSNGAATGGTPVLLGQTGTTDNYGHIKVWAVEVTVPFSAMNITLPAVSGQDIAGHYLAIQVDTWSLSQTASRNTGAAAQTVMTANASATYTATIPQLAAGSTAGNALNISCLAAQWPTAPTNVPTFNAPTSPLVERSEISAHKYVVSAIYTQVNVQNNAAMPTGTRTLTVSQTPRSICGITISIVGISNPIYDTRFTESATEGLTGATDSYQSSTPTWLQGAAFDYGSPVRDYQLAADGSQTPGTGASANTSGAQRVEDYVRLRSLTGTNLVYKTAGDDVLAAGSTGYFGISFRLDANYPVDPRTTSGNVGWQIISQFKNDGAGSPPFELSIGKGMLYLDGNSGGWEMPVCTVEGGQRYNVTMLITFTESGTTSQVSVWVNGTQYLNNATPEGYKKVSATQPGFLYSGQGVYWKIGSYRQSDGLANRGASRFQIGAIAYDTTLASVQEWLNRATLDPDPTTSYAAPVPIENVKDEFTTAIGAVWDEVVSNGGTNAPAVVNGQLRIQSVASNYYSGVRTFNKYSLKRSKFFMRVPRVAPLGTATEAETRVTFNSSADNGARLVISHVAQRGTIRFANETGYYDANGVEIPYDPVAHQYWQVRELNGQVFFETSPYGTDGSWEVRRTITAPNWVTWRPDERVVIESFRKDGDQQYAEIDNVNVVPTMLQKGGTATVAMQVTITPTGVARRFGTGQVIVGVGISPAASTKRGPNVIGVPVAVNVLTPLAQKVRPGQLATVAMAVTMQVTVARKNAIATVMMPVAVSWAIATGRKSVNRTATVQVGVAASVAFGQRQKRAITNVAVSASVTGARGLHRGTAAISMGMTITPSGSKSAQGLATTQLGVTMNVLVPPKRKLYPQVRENYQDPQEGMRYYLQDVRSGDFLHTEFPLEEAQITLALSGPDIIQGNFGFDIRDVDGIGLDGWSQWIHAELDGEISTSGLLLPWTYESRTNQLEANGASVYPHGIPWAADKQYIQADPMTIMSDIWEHVQTGPMSNLGVRFIPTPTPVKLGTEETEQVEFTTGGGGDSQENLDARVTVKRESVTQSVWDKLLSMGYTQSGSTPYAQAAAELRNRLQSGGNVYEDFSWTGMSANMGNNNDALADAWYGKNNANRRSWPPTAAEKTALIQMLSNIVNAGQGSLSVKKRDLITAQGGTPGTTNTNTSGTGGGEFVSFEAGGPYKLSWWEAPDCGGKIDELMKACPADYRERNYWDPYRTNVKHDIVTGYPRLGRMLDEPAFVQDENLVDSIALEEQPEDFATEVWVLGAGEGRDRVRGMASLTHKNRMRRVKVVEDKSITSIKVAQALAKEFLSTSQRPVAVRTVLINLDHDYARLGSFAPGDDVRVKTDVRGYGEIDLYHRVEKMSWVPKSMLCAVDLIRSDSIRYGVAS